MPLKTMAHNFILYSSVPAFSAEQLILQVHAIGLYSSGAWHSIEV